MLRKFEGFHPQRGNFLRVGNSLLEVCEKTYSIVAQR